MPNTNLTKIINNPTNPSTNDTLSGPLVVVVAILFPIPRSTSSTNSTPHGDTRLSTIKRICRPFWENVVSGTSAFAKWAKASFRTSTILNHIFKIFPLSSATSKPWFSRPTSNKLLISRELGSFYSADGHNLALHLHLDCLHLWGKNNVSSFLSGQYWMAAFSYFFKG